MELRTPKSRKSKRRRKTTIATTESKSKSVEKDTTENMKESTSEKSGAITAEKSGTKNAEKSEANTEEVFNNGNTKDTINMNTVTDFEVDGNTLIIYTNDGSAYEWER